MVRQAIPQEELEAVGAALREAEWGMLKGPNDVPGMWEFLARRAIEAYLEFRELAPLTHEEQASVFAEAAELLDHKINATIVGMLADSDPEDSTGLGCHFCSNPLDEHKEMCLWVLSRRAARR